MTSFKPASRAYAEDFTAEPGSIEAARLHAGRLGVAAVTPSAGAALRVLAAGAGAQHVVEMGTGTGVSGLWLLEGMPADGVLTTVDLSHEFQRAARSGFQQAGHAPQRTRLICGDVAAVLPRLADGAYDLAFIDTPPNLFAACADQAMRLLRPGGVLVLDHMLLDDRVAEPTSRDATTASVRGLGKQLRDDDRLTTSLLAVGDGLFVAVKR